MTLTEISRAHRNALAIESYGVTVCTVRSVDIEKFDKARRSLQDSSSELNAAGPLKDFASICSQIHARICRTPCRPAWIVESFKARLQSLQSALKLTLASADNRLRADYKAVCEHLAEIRRLQVNPLATEVGAMLDQSEKAWEHVIVVVRQQALWSEVRAALDPIHIRRPLVIMKPSELRRAQPVDRVILFGPPWLFAYRDELFLFRSPIGANVELFMYAHDCGGEISKSALDDQYLIFNGISARPIDAENLQNEPLFMFKRQEFLPREFPRTSGEHLDSLATCIEAWPIHLGGDMGTYLDPESSIFTVASNHDGELARCTGVERCDVQELESGDLVVLTTDGGGDLIRPLADEILGTAAETYRISQSEWKRRLTERVDLEGMASILEQLRTLGAVSANPPNVRTWMSERNIGPNNLNADFNAILRLVGLDCDREESFLAIDAIRRAHQSAGFQLHGRLKEALKGMDVRSAFIDGFLEVRSKAGGPAKTIFLIENIDRVPISVPSHAIGRIFALEDV